MKFSTPVSAATAIASLLLLLPSFVSAQLSGSVGPTTSTASKAAKKVCNILNYGAKADKKTDVGPAITSAWAACQSGGIGRASLCYEMLVGIVIDHAYSLHSKR